MGPVSGAQQPPRFLSFGIELSSDPTHPGSRHPGASLRGLTVSDPELRDLSATIPGSETFESEVVFFCCHALGVSRND